MSEVDKTVAEEAVKIVEGNRREAYGEKERNFLRIAHAWEAITDRPYTTEEVGLMMAALKIVRAAHSYQRDNYVDGVGYLLLAEAEHPKEAAKPEAPKDPAVVVTPGGTTTAPVATPTWGAGSLTHSQSCRAAGKMYCDFAQRCYTTETEHEQIHPDHP